MSVINSKDILCIPTIIKKKHFELLQLKAYIQDNFTHYPVSSSFLLRWPTNSVSTNRQTKSSVLKIYYSYGKTQACCINYSWKKFWILQDTPGSFKYISLIQCLSRDRLVSPDVKKTWHHSGARWANLMSTGAKLLPLVSHPNKKVNKGSNLTHYKHWSYPYIGIYH